jgi:hypothetical protein
MFIIYFLGDIHQPLHVEDYARGGNEIKVCFGHACSGNNLHSVWDKYIPHKICLKTSTTNEEEKVAAQQWADKLHVDHVVKGESIIKECADMRAPDKCGLAWAKEANIYICSIAMKERVHWLESNDLSQEYYDEAAPVVEYLIGKAGLRLAAFIEAMVSASTATASDRTGHEEQEPFSGLEL